MTIERTAADWVAREDRGPLSAAEAGALQVWLGADRRHLGAYARARAGFAHFDRARALGSQCESETDTATAKSRVHLRSRRVLWAAGLAASVCIAVLLQLTGGHHATETGEILRVPLADGSAVTLNSASGIEVFFDDDVRRVRLQHGEALFDVARDPDRPFIVEAASSRITAIGTSFTVGRVSDHKVHVLVREGVVELADVTRTQRAPVRLEANTLAVAIPSRKVTVQPLAVPEVERRLAWREGMLSFSGTTLEAAAQQFARYSDVRIVIDDPVVGQRRVVGLYSATDPVGFAEAVAMSLGLRAEKTPEGIHLRRIEPQ